MQRGLDGLSWTSSTSLPPTMMPGTNKSAKMNRQEEFNEQQMRNILESYEKEFDEKHAHFMQDGHNPFDEVGQIVEEVEEDFLADLRPERKGMIPASTLSLSPSQNNLPTRRKSMSPQQRRIKIETEDTLFNNNNPGALSLPILRSSSPSSPQLVSPDQQQQQAFDHLNHAKSMPQLQRNLSSNSGFMLGKKEKKEFFAHKLQELKEKK